MELFRIVMGLAALPLSSGAHCDGVMDASAEATVADWIAYNLAILENGAISLPSRCQREGDGWRCSVEFSVVNPDEQVFWRWGIRIDVQSGVFVPGSLMCIGAG